MPARAEIMGLSRQRASAMGSQRSGFQEISMPVQPLLNFVPLKQNLGLTAETKKVAGLSAPPPALAAGAVAGLAPAAAPKPRAACPRFGPVGEEEASDLCPQCRLPLGDLAYAVSREGGALLHGECKAQLLLEEIQKKDDARLKKDAALKRERRAKYDLGWKVQRVPRNMASATKLGLGALPQGLCALAFGENKTVSLVPTANPAASINLEYLSLALKCQIQDGREPMFSLDPKVDGTSNLHKLWHVKRYEPAWLDGTSAGEVLFQSDYHLKELSMGEYAQPVVGMRNALDFSAEQGLDQEWFAREWFVINKAEIQMAKGNVLLARVEMGVEARETFKGDKGLEDVPITRPDHPLVQYADAFTHNFELIAERKSVVYHLRELAKATVMAKFLVENRASLGEEWLSLADTSAGPSAHREIPQLWNEQRATQIQVEDGRIVSSGEGLKSAGKMHGIYGGAELAVGQMQRVGVPVGRVPTAKVSMARAPALSQRLIQARTGLAEMPLEVPGAAPGVPKGVDLNLDKFDLDQAAEVEAEAPVGSWVGEEFIGRAFWKNLSGAAFKDDDKAMLRDLFNPSMCDRREDCELFVPPDASLAHVLKLRLLLQEEAAVREQRKEHFLSAAFAPDSASALFPSWKPSATVAGSQAGQLHARPELVAEAGRLLKRAAAGFDKCTEDGARFRIYQLGSLEVRTIQEQGSEEVVGAVFSSAGAKAPSSTEQGGWSTVAKTDKIVKAVLYVEQDGEASISDEAPAKHFFALLETDHDDAVAVEMLRDGSFAWVESPADLEARKAQAKVIRAAECSMGYTVQELRARVGEAEAAASGDGRRYAEALLLLVLPAREKAWAALAPAELSLAGKLGVSGAEGWDNREADVFGEAWASLSQEQRRAAEALGFTEASWRPSASEAVQAPALPASAWARSWAELSSSQRAAAVALALPSQDSWEAKGAWQAMRREAAGIWEKTWAQLSEKERAAAAVLEIGGAEAWDGACWAPKGAWERRWAQLSQDECKAAEELGISKAAAWDAAFGDREKKGRGLEGVWSKSWAYLDQRERSAAKALGICGAGAWDQSNAKSSVQKKVAQLTEAEQEAMMAEWVKQTYGIGA